MPSLANSGFTMFKISACGTGVAATLRTVAFPLLLGASLVSPPHPAIAIPSKPITSNPTNLFRI